jgi:hypothetical protein
LLSKVSDRGSDKGRCKWNYGSATAEAVATETAAPAAETTAPATEEK